MVNLTGGGNTTTTEGTAPGPCRRLSPPHSMELTQLELVQILVMVVVMMVMVVVITCVLNHYRLSARSELSRGSARRTHLPLTQEAGLWSSEVASGALTEQQVFHPRPLDRGLHTSYLQREAQHSHPPLHSQRFQPTYGLRRFQPTFPFVPPSLIELPPTIALSDGEEPPPYQGPCKLQLRDPEQQMELNRESVRAPPNRTVFDSHPLGQSSPCTHAASLQVPPPSSHSGLRVLEAQEASSRQQKKRPGQDGAPPTHSEVIGHYFHPPSLLPQRHQTVSAPPASSLVHGPIPPAGVEARVESRNAREKPHRTGHV